MTAARQKPGKINMVVDSLGIDIAEAVYPPGSLLPPEPELEARFGASRTVIREATKMLAAKGLVSVRPRHGTRVRPRHEWRWLDPDLIRWISARGIGRAELLAFEEIRRIIEPAAAELAALRGDASQKHAVSAAYEAMLRGRNDEARAIRADKDFHLAVLDATQNPVLQSMRGAIEAVLGAVFDVTVVAFEGNLANHGRVAAAIARGNGDDARRAMEDVLGYTGGFLRSLDRGEPDALLIHKGDRPAPDKEPA